MSFVDGGFSSGVGHAEFTAGRRLCYNCRYKHTLFTTLPIISNGSNMFTRTRSGWSSSIGVPSIGPIIYRKLCTPVHGVHVYTVLLMIGDADVTCSFLPLRHAYSVGIHFLSRVSPLSKYIRGKMKACIFSVTTYWRKHLQLADLVANLAYHSHM